MKKSLIIFILLLSNNIQCALLPFSFLPCYGTSPSREKHFTDYLDTKYEIIPTPPFSFAASLLIGGLIGFNTDKLSASRQAVGIASTLIPATTIRYQTWQNNSCWDGKVYDQGIGLSFGISERHAKTTFIGTLIGFGGGMLIKQAINFNNSKKS